MPELGGVVVRRLREALGRRAAATITDEEASRAAVAVVVSAGDDPAILLVRRQQRAGDPWSGQMAFPGGFHSPADESLTVTASRETAEETGLDLSVHGELLGTLDDVAPRSVLLPRVVVRPFVFTVPLAEPLHAGPEVDEVVWLRVAELFDPASRKPYTVSLPIGSRTFASMQVNEYVVWGLTERVLEQFRHVAVI